MGYLLAGSIGACVGYMIAAILTIAKQDEMAAEYQRLQDENHGLREQCRKFERMTGVFIDKGV